MYKRLYLLVAVLCIAVLSSCSGPGEVTVPGDFSDSSILRPPPVSPDERLGTTTPAQDYEPGREFNAIAGPRFESLKDSIDEGLGYLFSVRKSLPFSDCGGTTYPYTWEWYVGANTGNLNIPGNVCASILLSSAASSSPAANFADGMLTVDNFIIPLFSTGGCSENSRPYASDVYSLYLAWMDGGDTSYLDKAYELAGRTIAAYTGAAYADRMINERYSMAGWDAAPYIFAWYLVGDAKGDSAMTAWAKDMADQMIARWNDWEYAGWYGSAWDYTQLSYGHMLKALCIVDAAGYSNRIEYLRGEILDAQNEDGWWPVYYLDYYGPGVHYEFDDVQATAYILEGLNADNHPITMLARFGGEAYLRSADIQMADGRFAGYIGDPDIYPEICGEALRGLGSMPYGVIESDTNRKVTGGGWITGAVSGYAHFGFNVKVKKTGELQGSLCYTDADSGIDFETTDMTTMYVFENEMLGTFTASVYGTGVLNGQDVGFTVSVEDNGEPGLDDSFSIKIGDYTNYGGSLCGGNVKVHKN